MNEAHANQYIYLHPLAAYSTFMRTECLNSKFVFDAPLPTARLVSALGDSMCMVCSAQKGTETQPPPYDPLHNRGAGDYAAVWPPPLRRGSAGRRLRRMSQAVVWVFYF